MSGFKDFYASAPIYNIFGEITGSAVAIQMPSGSCFQVRFKASEDNIGHIYLGHDANHCFWMLGAGDDSGWICVDDMNKFWHSSASGTVDRFAYHLQR